jgi:hypothetical protein
MTAQNPDFQQPPWVQSPSEVMKWIDDTHPSKKSKSHTHGASGGEILRNLHVCFDFNVEQKKIRPTNILSKLRALIPGHGLVEEGFDLAPTAELVVRGLAKAKFKKIFKVVIDKKTVYSHSDSSEAPITVDDFGKMTHEFQMEKSVEVITVFNEGKRSTATISIKKVHKAQDHAVDIQIRGGIKKELYHTFLNYLSEKLDLKEPIGL